MEPNSEPSSNQDAHRVRHVSPPVEVPVYNCLALVTPRNAEGLVTARAANLAGVTAEGKSEREALAGLVAAFKGAVSAHRENGRPIPWAEPPEEPQPGDQQRFIAVHL